jgi:hypothetical protein
MEQYKVFIFNSPRECRLELYDLNGKLIRHTRAKDPQEARTLAAQYLTSLQQSASEDKQRVEPQRA